MIYLYSYIILGLKDIYLLQFEYYLIYCGCLMFCFLIVGNDDDCYFIIFLYVGDIGFGYKYGVIYLGFFGRDLL